ncbi:hypothetical protein [Arthrobacter sp. NicSoilB4]|uniref:hypothetical protein n=1 Tax=Arthrobacter sp. NicSoilB4 TaxID=2830997 RepID=UPI001CC60496|nr:hypothetical protein [Arthrobacter sp. NicSoilB4]
MGYKAEARRLAAVCMILAAGVSLSACGGEAKAAGTPAAPLTASAESSVSGYEGWWNSTPADGKTAGLPQEAVAVNTRTNTVVDAFSRRINDAGRATLITDVPYTVVPDPSWPADSVIIIDTATNKVIEDFRVDLDGNPLR